MADTSDGGPSLEMPSLSLRGRSRRPEGSAPRPRRPVRPAATGGPLVAALAGLVVGGLAVLLGWLAGVGCEAVRGTSSCGGGPGLLVLLGVLVVLAWTGGLLLRLLGVRDAGSTSVLAVAVLAVLVMVFLLDRLDDWQALVAVPVAAAVAFCAARWVTASAEAGRGSGSSGGR